MFRLIPAMNWSGIGTFSLIFQGAANVGCGLQGSWSYARFLLYDESCMICSKNWTNKRLFCSTYSKLMSYFWLVRPRTTLSLIWQITGPIQHHTKFWKRVVICEFYQMLQPLVDFRRHAPSAIRIIWQSATFDLSMHRSVDVYRMLGLPLVIPCFSYGFRCWRKGR